MKKRLGGICVVLAGASLAVVGCGGDNLRCGEVAPCGGDLVGSWEMKGACVDVSRLEAASAEVCPGFRIVRFEASVSGSLTFTATDYTSSASTSISFEETIPADCPLLEGATCAQLGASLEGGSCSGDAVCTCSGTITNDLFSAAGTYTISGTTLSLTDAATGETDSGPYCVSDGVLHLPSVSADPMGMMGETFIGADLVGERR